MTICATHDDAANSLETALSHIECESLEELVKDAMLMIQQAKQMGQNMEDWLVRRKKAYEELEKELEEARKEIAYKDSEIVELKQERDAFESEVMSIRHN